MKWFRLYSEARNDAKLRALSDAQHRIWFNLLCYSSEMETRGCINSVDRELLSVECAGGDIDLLNETLEKLMRLRIVTASEESVCFVNFMKRQYDKPSDTPARVSERVSRHRMKPETPETERVTLSNASVTPKKRAYSDTDTDTDTEDSPKKENQPTRDQSKQIQLKTFCDFYSAYPVKQARQDAEKAWLKLSPDDTLRGAIMAGLLNAKGSEEWHEDGGKYIPHPATFLNRRRWEDVYTPDGTRIIAPARTVNRSSQPNTMQGMIDDTARAVRSEEARLVDMLQASQRKGLPQ